MIRENSTNNTGAHESVYRFFERKGRTRDHTKGECKGLDKLEEFLKHNDGYSAPMMDFMRKLQALGLPAPLIEKATATRD